MKENDLTSAEDSEAEIAIELFNLLVEGQQAKIDSRDPHRSGVEKDALFQQSVKLERKFAQLADQVEGKAKSRKSSKGSAYCLAAYYLSQYPNGSVTVTKNETPSLVSFATSKKDEMISLPLDRLEIGRCHGGGFELALNGGAMKNYSLDAIKVAFTRAKKSMQSK